MPDRGVSHDGTRWSNAGEDRIEVVDPDPAWSAAFELEATALRAVLRDHPGIRVEHFGSTAVSGLRAKPIIDILIVHPAQEHWPALVAALLPLGYVHWADNPRKDRMFFVKGMPPFGSRRTHHVHVRLPADAEAELRFRDALRADAVLARRYAELKDRLAVHFADDRDAYTEAKSEFVAEALRVSG